MAGDVHRCAETRRRFAITIRVTFVGAYLLVFALPLPHWRRVDAVSDVTPRLQAYAFRRVAGRYVAPDTSRLSPLATTDTDGVDKP